MNIKYFIFIPVFCFFFCCQLHAAELLVETESFTNKGGWVVDQQFMEQMGSPYPPYNVSVPLEEKRVRP